MKLLIARMRISSPGTQNFPGNSLFQFILNCSPTSSHSRGIRRHFVGDKTLSSPSGPCTSVSTSIRSIQASGQSFLVIFIPHSSVRAECECLSYIHRFQLSFTCPCPSWFRPAAVHLMLENHYYSVVLVQAISDVRIHNVARQSAIQSTKQDASSHSRALLRSMCVAVATVSAGC